MKFDQPRLPYASDALAPFISKQTIDFHYGKHTKAYIDNLNNLIKDTDYAEMPLEDIILNSDGILFNNAAQTWNHIFYFFQFSPVSEHTPSGRIAKQINKQFGSFDEFKLKFEDAGTRIFGSGWVWLSTDSDGTLFITQTSNADNPLRNGLKPILTFDVWEHAYYLDFQNRRGEHLRGLWDIIDWEIIESRYDIAT